METRHARSTDAVRRVGTGLSQIAAPLLLAVGFAIHPAGASTGAEQLQVIADSLGRWNAAHIVILAGVVPLIPATLGLARLLERRGPWFGLIGAALATVGLVFLSALVGAEALGPSAMATLSAADRTGVGPGVQAILDMRGAMPVVLLGLAFQIGLIFLAVGLIATRTIPRWQSALIGLAGVIMVAVNSDQILAVGAVALFAGLAPIGLRTIRGDTARPDRVAAAPGMQLAHS
jgi:hypothetical protein